MPSLAEAEAAVLKTLPKVVADYQARPDYGPTQAAAVKTLDGFKQTVLTAQSAEAASAEQLSAMAGQAKTDVLPLLATTISQNLEMAKMGQLSRARTITPEMAKAHNASLATLQDQVQTLLAEIAAAASGGGGGEGGGGEPVDWQEVDWSHFGTAAGAG